MIMLYNQHNFHTMPSLANDEARYIKAFFTPYVLGKSTHYIKNVTTTVKLLLVDDTLLPITINDAEYENAYVSSLYSHYISYALEELYLLRRPIIEKGLAKTIQAVGAYLKRRDIDRVIYVNNWLFSTNLYPALTTQQIEEMKRFLVREYPKHLIVFRSLSNYLHMDLIRAFQQSGFKELASRQVYIAQPYERLNKKTLAFIKQDLRQLQRQGYEVVEDIKPTEANIARLAQLYNKLYIDKYSTYNPQFTHEFYRYTMKHQLIKYIAVAKDGVMVGCIGYWQLGGVMTTPILGYDVDLGKQSALYRILSALIYEECEKHTLIGHRSAGASGFKIKRGAIPSIEYSLVFNEHLPAKRRRAVSLLRFICNEIGVSVLSGKKL